MTTRAKKPKNIKTLGKAEQKKVVGGKTPTPGGPIPIPYPNTAGDPGTSK